MLAVLTETPKTAEDWARWSYHHRESHARIRQRIAAKGGPRLVEYVLEPIDPNDFASFLEANSQSHIDMDAFLGFQSADLLEVDFRDEEQRQAWIGVHYKEHESAEFALGI